LNRGDETVSPVEKGDTTEVRDLGVESTFMREGEEVFHEGGSKRHVV